MVADIDISTVTEADIEPLGHILLRAMEPEMTDRFMAAEEGFEAAYASKMRWYLSEMPSNLADPARRFFKATLKGTDTVAAFGAIMYKDGTFEDTPASSVETKPADPVTAGMPPPPPAAATLPIRKREEFIPFYFGSMRKIYRRHMEGQKHVVWTSLFVKPEYQKQGIGTALLRWGFKEFDLEKEKVWIQTQMRGRNVYRRYGWEEVDHLNIDLSEWGGKLRGFGVHRSPCMLRQPGPFEKIDGIVDE